MYTCIYMLCPPPWPQGIRCSVLFAIFIYLPRCPQYYKCLRGISSVGNATAWCTNTRLFCHIKKISLHFDYSRCQWRGSIDYNHRKMLLPFGSPRSLLCPEPWGPFRTIGIEIRTRVCHGTVVRADFQGDCEGSLLQRWTLAICGIWPCDQWMPSLISTDQNVNSDMNQQLALYLTLKSHSPHSNNIAVSSMGPVSQAYNFLECLSARLQNNFQQVNTMLTWGWSTSGDGHQNRQHSCESSLKTDGKTQAGCWWLSAFDDSMRRSQGLLDKGPMSATRWQVQYSLNCNQDRLAMSQSESDCDYTEPCRIRVWASYKDPDEIQDYLLNSRTNDLSTWMNDESIK